MTMSFLMPGAAMLLGTSAIMLAVGVPGCAAGSGRHSANRTEGFGVEGRERDDQSAGGSE